MDSSQAVRGTREAPERRIYLVCLVNKMQTMQQSQSPSPTPGSCLSNDGPATVTWHDGPVELRFFTTCRRSELCSENIAPYLKSLVGRALFLVPPELRTLREEVRVHGASDVT